MTNRDKLYKICTYDLLCRINNGLRNIDAGDVCVIDAGDVCVIDAGDVCVIDAGDVCVVDALTGHYVHSLHCVDKSCDKCILEYLDREAKV